MKQSQQPNALELSEKFRDRCLPLSPKFKVDMQIWIVYYPKRRKIGYCIIQKGKNESIGNSGSESVVG